MSQLLTPLDGGVQEIQTALTDSNQLRVLSQQYIQSKHLENRPTQWVPGGRPIYRRLPSVSETYQIDFFNVVPAPNTAVSAEVQDIGYVYVPWGTSQNGENTLAVATSDSDKDLLTKGGTVVWKYGNTDVLPTIVNLEIVDVVTGSYDLAYQLTYDDSPLQKLYRVEDFALTGLPLTIVSSVDNVIGWRYGAVNAFLNGVDTRWSNTDTYFPPFAQPTQSYLQWESDLTMAYTSVTLRCPTGSVFTGSATLNYFDGVVYTPVETVSVSTDTVGQFFKFTVDPRFQTGWQVVFSSLGVSIESIVVSGVITLMEKQAALSTRATLVMYPSGSMPKTITNSQGELTPATYCPLAVIEVGREFNVVQVKDARYIINRDFQPIADWLTKPFDDNLINLFDQVSNYSDLWMTPDSCMKQEYATLEESQVEVKN